MLDLVKLENISRDAFVTESERDVIIEVDDTRGDTAFSYIMDCRASAFDTSQYIGW